MTFLAVAHGRLSEAALVEWIRDRCVKSPPVRRDE
jgi:hypothetical protein